MAENTAVNPQELFGVIQTLQAQIAIMSETMAVMQARNEIFNLHFAEMYEAKSIDETLSIMKRLGEHTILAEQCNVYSVDSRDKMFTTNEDNERKYISIQDNPLIKKAYEEKTVQIDNKYQGNDNEDIMNVMVVPLIDKADNVIGIVTAQNKDGGFTREDAETFDLQKGNLGTAFCMGLENKALVRQATIDELTGLENRRRMNEIIKTEVLGRVKSNQPVSVLQIDANWFKQVNDNLGHNEGDKALKVIANAIMSNTRKEDTSAIRQGGDEFCVILPVAEKQAFEIAERIRHAVEDERIVFTDEQTGTEKQLTVSIGVAQYQTDNYNLNKGNVLEDFTQNAIAVADERLYLAKEMKAEKESVTICSDELNVMSKPSPTKILDEYLRSLDVPLIQHKDGYELADELISVKRVVDAKELVNALSDFTEANITSDLRAYAADYEAVNGVEFEFAPDDSTTHDWAEFVKVPVKEEFKPFAKQCEKELAIIDALENHANEIKLDKIAEKAPDLYKREVKENKSKHNDTIER